MLQAREVPVRRDAGEVVARCAVGLLRLQNVSGFRDEARYRVFGQPHVVGRDAGLARIEHFAIDDSAHCVGEARGVRVDRLGNAHPMLKQQINQALQTSGKDACTYSHRVKQCRYGVSVFRLLAILLLIDA